MNAKESLLGYKIDDTPICVDYWNVTDGDEASNRFYFLTHAHFHSMYCLTPSWRHSIICSPITAKIVQILHELPPESFTTIEIGQTVSIDCGDRNKNFQGRRFDVTALEANHCPGSIMFLFDGWFGRILSTGGFRFENDHLFDLQLLRQTPIDRLYLDCTYWKIEEEIRAEIPTRRQSIWKTLQKIAGRPTEETIVLVTPDSVVGQELVLTEIGRNFEEPIAVSELRLKYLKEIVEDHEVFTDDPQQTRFRLINGTKGQIKRMFKDEVADRPVSVFVFATPTSATDWRKVQNAKDAADYDFRRCLNISMYSDHSSTLELENFLKQLSIRKLVVTGGRLDEAAIDSLRQRFETPANPLDATSAHKDNRDIVAETIVIDSTPESIPNEIAQRPNEEESISENPPPSNAPAISDSEVRDSYEQQEKANDGEEESEDTPPMDLIMNKTNNMTFTDLELAVKIIWENEDLFGAK